MTGARQTPPDQPERDRALQVGHSFIVQAPAGSGKTTLLVDRYLHLLSQVAQPEEVLAITFTRAAAAEMKQRVLQELRKDTPLTENIRNKDEAHNWRLKQNPERMKIQTIDSFAKELATQIPGSQSAEGMRIEEQPAPLYLRAAQNVLGRLFLDDPSGLFVAEFLSALDNNASTAERVLSTMLRKRDQWLDVTGLITSMALSDGAAITQTLDRAITELRQEIMLTVTDALSPHDNEMIQIVASQTDRQANLEALLPLILTQSGTIRKTIDRRHGEAFGEKSFRTQIVEWFDELRDRNLEELLQTCAMLPKVGEDSATIVATGVTLALAAAELEILLQRRQTVDFTGILMRASQGLRDDEGPTDLALYWDYKIKHLLVDEFQDTSRSQYKFFCLLTEGWTVGEGNTFFAVGDPMQSIYRFRDADVSIFSQCWHDGLPNVALQTIRLQANFRSSKNLVEWTNNLFKQLFPRSALPKLGAIPFAPALAQKPVFSATDTDSTVQLHCFASEQLEAEAIALHVSTLLAQKPADRQYRIGILCRARTHLPKILRALKAADIAYTSTDIDALATAPVVTDLLSLLSLLLRPARPLPWFAILRSPMVGLSLQQLEQFASATDLGDFVSQQAHYHPAIERFASALYWARPRLYELPIAEVVEGCWMRLGGVDAYAHSSLSKAQRWFELIESMGDSALDPDIVQARTDELYAQDVSQTPVQVMTIHKSKGLEFTHVILPNLGRQSRTEETDIMLWRPNNNDLLIGIKNDSVHDWLAFEEKNRRENEAKRLLYVACTRAETSLWLSTASRSQRPQGLARYLPFTPGNVQSPAQDNAKSPVVPPESQAQLIHLPASYRWHPYDTCGNDREGIAKINPALESSDAEQAAAADDEAPQSADDRQNRFSLSLGNLVHQALAYIAQCHKKGVPYGPVTIHEHLDQWLPGLDAFPDQWPLVKQATIEHIDRTLADPAGQWLLTAHPHGQIEWPVTTVSNGLPKRLVMDRVFFAEDCWWIVDFKTAEPAPGEALTTFLEHEVGRYRCQLDQYRSALAALLSDQPNRFETPAATVVPSKTALYFTALAHLETLPFPPPD